ncbi:hypothetical protein ECC02_009170 [Trypanosoma cruzi]|uniref:Uncharacterized protein n=1 Tax=Trypanosoma cruzi TaxID=5693 RepID=A0A7J6XTX8_TRYCR|nr:hypothetical protein ECC02_009170 [Trypanosoma cruzi]
MVTHTETVHVEQVFVALKAAVPQVQRAATHQRQRPSRVQTKPAITRSIRLDVADQQRGRTQHSVLQQKYAKLVPPSVRQLNLEGLHRVNLRDGNVAVLREGKCKHNDGGPHHRLAHTDQDAGRLHRHNTPNKLQRDTLTKCAPSERDIDGEMQRHTVEKERQRSTHAAERHTRVAVVRLPHVQREARQRLVHHAARVAVDGSLRYGRHNRVGHLEWKTRRAMPSVLAAARARAAVHRLRPGNVARSVIVACATPEHHHVLREHAVVRHLLIALQVAPNHKPRG